MAGKTQYKRQWNEANLDRLNITVKKGEKDKIKAHAESLGLSLNAYVNQLISKDMEDK